MSATLDIRRERPADRDAVHDVIRAAFVDHGAHVVGLVEPLRDLISVDRGASLVALEGHEVIGHVMFTPSLLDAPRALVTVQVLSPLAVLPAAQRRGVGSALVRRGVRDRRRPGRTDRLPRGQPGLLLAPGLRRRRVARVPPPLAAHPRASVSGDESPSP